MLSSSKSHFKKRRPAIAESSGGPLGGRWGRDSSILPLAPSLPLLFPSLPQRCVGMSGKTLTNASNLERDQSGRWRQETKRPAKRPPGGGGWRRQQWNGMGFSCVGGTGGRKGRGNGGVKTGEICVLCNKAQNSKLRNSCRSAAASLALNPRPAAGKSWCLCGNKGWIQPRSAAVLWDAPLGSFFPSLLKVIY